MCVGCLAHDVEVLEPDPPIETDVMQVLAEKSEAFAEKKYSDECQHHHGDEGIATEHRLDETIRAPTTSRWRGDDRRNREFWHGERWLVTGGAGKPSSLTFT